MRNLKATKFSETTLAQMSMITQADIEAARLLWSQTVPLRWKPLLDSQTVGVDNPLNSVYVWDASERRYIHLRSRRYVPFQDIRDQAIEPLIQRSKTAQRVLSQQLQSGDMPLSEWQLIMMDNIKHAELAASLAANGGGPNTNDADKKKISEAILIMLLLFQAFAQEIASGQQPLNGSLLVRSDLYASAARSQFDETQRAGMNTYFGVVQERRILGKAEHCHTVGDLQGCIELAAKGWQLINTLPRLGQSPCRSNCKCRWQFRYLDTHGNWVFVDDSKIIAVILLNLSERENDSSQSG